MRKLIVLFLAIFILGTVSVSADWKVVSKDKDWNTFIYEEAGFSIDIPKVLDQSDLGENKSGVFATFRDGYDKIDEDHTTAIINIHIEKPSKYPIKSFNDCTDEEFKNFLKEYQVHYFYNILPAESKCEEIILNENRCIALTTAIGKQKFVVKAYVFVVDKQTFEINSTYRPNKWSKDFLNKIINSIKFTKTDNDSK